MTIEETRFKAIMLIDQQLNKLSRIIRQASRDFDYGVGEKRLCSWKTDTVKMIKEIIHPEEGEKLLRKHANDSGSKRTQEVVEENGRLYRSFLLNVKESLRKCPEKVFLPDISQTSQVTGRITENTGDSATIEDPPRIYDKRIFIIFGRDELNCLRLEKFLRKSGFQNLELINTILEKEQYLSENSEPEVHRGSCAFFLFSQEDFIRKTGTKALFIRPEFLFRLGWFCGKLGHQRIRILSKNGMNLIPELTDFINIEFEDSVINASEVLGETLIDLGFD